MLYPIELRAHTASVYLFSIAYQFVRAALVQSCADCRRNASSAKGHYSGVKFIFSEGLLMNKTSICTLFALITLLVGTAVGQNATEQEIAKLEQQFNGAYAKNDLEPYFSFYAPDAIQWLPEG